MSSVEEVFKSMKKVSSFYATTTTFATSTKSTHCSKLSGVLRMTHSSQRRGIWNDIWLLVVIVLNLFTKNVYELRETLFDKLDAFNIPYGSEQKLFENWAKFHVESICVKEVSYKQSETTTWIGKHVSILVSISSNLTPEPIFLCNAYPHHLVFYHCSRRISNSKQNSDEIEFH